MVAKLRDEPLELWPGCVVRSFSLQHLRLQNVRADYPPEALAAELEKLENDAARQLALRLHKIDEPQPDDRDLAIRAVHLGHGFGLGAAWGVSPEADALWAGVAHLLEARGVQHPNELPSLQQG